MRRLFPKETRTFRRGPIKAVVFAALAVMVLGDASAGSVTGLLWMSPLVAMFVAGGLGALIPFGDLQRILAVAGPSIYLGVTFCIGSIRGFVSEGFDVDGVMVPIVLIGGLVFLFLGLGGVRDVWRWRGVLILPPSVSRQVQSVPPSVGGYYREVSLMLDNGDQLPVVGVFLDRYTRLGRPLYGHRSRLKDRRVLEVGPPGPEAGSLERDGS